jgi:hypothetical protein
MKWFPKSFFYGDKGDKRDKRDKRDGGKNKSRASLKRF